MDDGFRIIYCDEVMFSSRTQLSKCWSLPNSPLEIDLSHFKAAPVAVIAAISFDKGVDIVRMHKKSIDTKKFLVFLDDIRR